MAEIDLIPVDYRRAVSRRSWVWRLALVYGALLLCIGASFGWLKWEVHAQQAELEMEQVVLQTILQRRTQVEDLRREAAESERQLAVLGGLRGGLGVRQLFLAVDRSLDGSVWFVDWTFRRAGEFVESASGSIPNGYFVVVPGRGPDAGSERAWRVRTHMEIRARALDHTALADFVRKLVAQREIESVRVLSTNTRAYTSAEIVEFELAVVVREAA